MTDVHVRAILLALIGFLCIGGGVVARSAYENLPAVLALVGLVAIGGAVFMLFFADEGT